MRSKFWEQRACERGAWTKFWRKELEDRGARQNFPRRHVLLSFCSYPHTWHLTNTYMIFSVSLSYEQRRAASSPLSLSADRRRQAASSPLSLLADGGRRGAAPQRQKLWAGAPSTAACSSYLCDAFARLRGICGVSYRDAMSMRHNRRRHKSSPDGGPSLSLV
jgi:hypothetical protein